MEPTLEDRARALELLIPMALASGSLSAVDLRRFAGIWRGEIEQRAAVILHPALLYPTSDQALEQVATLLEEAADLQQRIPSAPFG